ncbi:hypothetical protein ACU6U9_16255 [Pseudomonas sp. HK3]
MQLATHNKTCNARQQAGWTALSAASQQSCPFTQRYVLLLL